MIAWPSGVNQIIRSETRGNIPSRVVRDNMRSGKDKKRFSSSTIPDTFPVVMVFELEEWEIFESWFKHNLRGGMLNFSFPTIAGTGMSEYEIVTGLDWDQFGASSMKVTMTWRKVE